MTADPHVIREHKNGEPKGESFPIIIICNLISQAAAVTFICLTVSSIQAADASKSRFDAILAQFGFHGLEQPNEGVIDNLVEREPGHSQREIGNSFEDSKVGDRVARRVPLVRLDLDNRPFLVYGDDSKMLKKMKRVKKTPGVRRPKAASPLVLRKLKRRPRLVVRNSEGELAPPRLHHLNARVPKMYSFKSRYDMIDKKKICMIKTYLIQNAVIEHKSGTLSCCLFLLLLFLSENTVH